LLTSAPSKLNFGIEPLQLDSGFRDGELLIDGSLFVVDAGGPSGDFGWQYLQFADPSVLQALAGQATQLAFGVGEFARFLRTSALSNPSRTKARRTFSTVCLRPPTASLILVSIHVGPSVSALNKIVARRSFSDLPFSIEWSLRRSLVPGP
jgi:hypothetical protein